MSASLSPDPSKPEEGLLLLQTEAEGHLNVLMDLGLNAAVNLDGSDIFFSLSETTTPSAAAIDVARIVDRRWREDAEYRESAISYIATCGPLLCEAPGVSVSLRAAPAADVIQALAKAGLLLRYHYERDEAHTPMLSFTPLPGNPIAPNAHILMKLAVDRFHDDADFAAAVTRFAVDTGLSGHAS